MAKFCGNCGTQMPDDARVCGNCGTPFAGATPYTIPAAQATVNGADDNSPTKREKNKKLGMLICAGAAVVLILAILIGVIAGNSGYKGTIKKFVNAIEEYDIGTLEEMTSSSYTVLFDFLGSDADVGELWEEELEDITAEFDKYLGTDYKLDYEIVSAYEASTYRMDQLLNAYYDMDGFNPSLIEEMKIVNLTITAKGKKTERVKRVELVLSKEDGKWKIFEFDFS